MNPKTDHPEIRRAFAFFAPFMLALVPVSWGQDASDVPDKIVELSPFTVDGSRDSGYRATNSISAMRVNGELLKTPLTMEVLTEEFIEDIGALDLRESLQYSAGVLLQTQNDALEPDQFRDTGGVHNPEGATNNKTNTTIKMRGFLTEASLRNGFRRQHATDSINIGRVEVLRGPSALLYGVGNFGGIVNVMPKMPLAEKRDSLALIVGSDSLFRGEFDTSAPFTSEGSGYRVTGVVETRDDWLDQYSSDKVFIAPIFTYQASERTKFIFDFEYGKQKEEGTSFQSLRLPPVDSQFANEQQDRLETLDLLSFPNQDRRTFRWSGDDTFIETEAGNALIQVDHKLAENLYIQAGYNYSFVDFDTRDITGAVVQGRGPESLRDSVLTQRLVNDGNDADAPVVNGAIVEYRWRDQFQEDRRDQIRVDINYKTHAFGDSKLLSSTHELVAGFSYETLDRTNLELRSSDWNYKSPTDSSYFTFGTQGDGSPDTSMINWDHEVSDVSNEGVYGIYQGRFFDERLTLVGGVRLDTSKNDVVFNDFLNDNLDQTTNSSDEETTYQFGANLEVLDGLALYGVYSEGLTPNWDGLRDSTGGVMAPTKAEAREVGVKFDIVKGKISGYISKFKIERTGVPRYFWFAPTTERQRFITNSDIVYRLDHYVANRSYVEAGDADEWWARTGDNLLLGTGDLRDILDQQGLSVDLESYGTSRTIQNNNRGSYLDSSLLSATERQNLIDAIAVDGRDTLGNGGIRGSASGQFDAALATLLDDNPGNDAVLFSKPKSAADNSVTDAWKAYINLSTPEGAAFMDKIFAETEPDQTIWPGWLFEGIYDGNPRDLNINGAALDVSTPDGGATSANYTAVEDSSEGYEAEILFTPNENWQTRLTYSNVTRQLDKPLAFISYPYDDDDRYWDRWTPWYFPNASWGLTGRLATDQYPGGTGSLPSRDTSEFVGFGYGVGQSLDDTPEHVYSLWTAYNFKDGMMKGVTLGFGGFYESKRLFASQFTTAGQVKESPEGSGLQAFTDTRLTLNAMIKYERTLANDRDLTVQLNVDNALDDDDRYGLIYAPGLSWRLGVGMGF